MTLTGDPPIAGQSNSQQSAVLKFQMHWCADPFLRVRASLEFDRAFDSINTWNRKAGRFDYSLIPANAIPYFAQNVSIQQKFPDTGIFLDQLHHHDRSNHT